MQKAQIAIIGCGNSNRSDDGVGPSVIALLRCRTLPENVTLFDAGTDGMGVMYQARGCSHLILVDAKSPETNPGAIYEVPGEVLASPPPQSINLHDFRWDHALFAGQRIYGSDFPEHVKVFLIEARSLDYGLELSEEVSVAASNIAERIASLVAQVAAGGWE